MKKVKKILGRKFIIVALMCFTVGMLMPMNKVEAAGEVAQETRTTLVTSLSGELKPNASKSKTFYTNQSLAVKVVYGSSAQEGNQSAPITIYIDGKWVAKSNGNTSGFTIWNLTPGTHTLKVVNGNVWSAFAVDIATI